MEATMVLHLWKMGKFQVDTCIKYLDIINYLVIALIHSRTKTRCRYSHAVGFAIYKYFRGVKYNIENKIVKLFYFLK